MQRPYAFGDWPGAFNSGAPGECGRSDGILLTFHSPLFDVRGIYDELLDSNRRFSSIFTTSREYIVGGNLRAKKLKILAAHTHYAAPDSSVGAADSADHYWRGATYRATPHWAVTAAGFYIQVGEGGGDASQDPSRHGMPYALGTTYKLSARMFLYATVVYVENSNSVFATPRDSSTPTTSPMAGNSQTGASYIGMMDVF